MRQKGSGQPAFLIDTDAGIDDILAIIQLVRNGINLVGITVVATGLCPPGAAGLNLLRLMLYLKDMTTRIAVGKDKAFGEVQHKFPVTVRSSIAQMFNGEPFDTLLPIPTAADQQRLSSNPVALMNNSVKQHGPLTILALGPLTNIASFISKHPECTGHIRIVSMGGVFSVPGNIKDFEPDNAIQAEWNYYADPGAVAFLFKAMPSRILIVPLDATLQVPFTEEFYNRIKNAPNDDMRLIFACFRPIIDEFGLPAFLGGFCLWDPAAAMIAIRSISYAVQSERCVIDPTTSQFIKHPSGVPLFYVGELDGQTARDQFIAALNPEPPQPQPRIKMLSAL